MRIPLHRALRRPTAASRVEASWQELARHADVPCGDCLPAVRAVRSGSPVPPDLVAACCGGGRDLFGAWIRARDDLVDRLIGLSQA